MGTLTTFDSSTMCGLHGNAVQERTEFSKQLPADVLITYIGVGMILGAATLIGLKTYLESTIPEHLFDRRKSR